MVGYNPYPVIPAKAGIQIYTPQSWIPAFAGMTSALNTHP